MTRSAVRIFSLSKRRFELHSCHPCPTADRTMHKRALPQRYLSRACRTWAAQVRALCGALCFHRVCPTRGRSPREVASWRRCQSSQARFPVEISQQPNILSLNELFLQCEAEIGCMTLSRFSPPRVDSASAENRTRVTSMATMYSATRPLMLTTHKMFSMCVSTLGSQEHRHSRRQLRTM